MRRRLLLSGLVLMLSVAAHAQPLTWILQNVTFDDGGTASGSFTFDATTGSDSNVNIATTAGTVLTGNTLKPG